MRTATNDMKHGLAITECKGFNMTFEHGTSISVQFGKGNYASNRDDQRDPKDICIYGSGSAEICIWNAKNEDLVNKFDKGKSSDGLVIGWCNPEYVAKAIAWTVKYDEKYGKRLAFEENCETCDFKVAIGNISYCGQLTEIGKNVTIQKIHKCPLDKKEDK